MEDRIRLSITDGIADVRLNRADKMNALDPAMFKAIADIGARLKQDTSVRAVVLSGEGRAFCAGLDVERIAALTRGESILPFADLTQRTHGIANFVQHIVWIWREIAVPVIAAVHGLAFGGGFQLALGADLRYVAPGTRLGLIESKWGGRVRQKLSYAGIALSFPKCLLWPASAFGKYHLGRFDRMAL
jgi:enoyl-CoA hydratase/carnithine racemase